ncbi:MAG TPA: response regulator transcription factor [Candidatus Deferrimicrobium sp.]|nr:response regulator transcription factor [Candidatus Deferrimicrobium sp.]
MNISGGAPTIGVVIIDDDALLRAGLALILGGAADIVIVGEAGDGAEGIEVVRRSRPQVVLMDIRMPRLNGVEATRRLMSLQAPPQVLVLTTFDADEYVVRALAAGASGFLLKDTPPEAIVDAVRRIAAGEQMLSPTVLSSLIRQVTAGSTAEVEAEARASLKALTARELEVARAVGQGRSNADIAAELFMSISSVKAHVSRVLTKVGVDNRVQIAILVHDARLV